MNGGSLYGEPLEFPLDQSNPTRRCVVFHLSRRLRCRNSHVHVFHGHQRNHALVVFIGVPRWFHGVLTLNVSTPQNNMAKPVLAFNRRAGQSAPSNDALSHHGFSDLEETSYVGTEYVIAISTILLGGFVRILVNGHHNALKALVNFLSRPRQSEGVL